MIRGAVGVAAVGAAGGAVLAQVSAAPALASTTVEAGALAPAVVNLTDAATIAVDASQGNDFRLTLGGNRTMGSPANPTDGQKIVFQITQGSAAPSTVAWSDGYAFSGALPQPTLSAQAGQTDLLGFIYNQSKQEWLLAASVLGFGQGVTASPSASPSITPTPTPTPTPSPSQSQQAGTFRLFSSVAGPAAPASYSGPFVAGVVFTLTEGGTWFDGYWWWVCNSGQSTSAQKFALWQVYTNATGSLIAAGTVTSGSLTPGQWNWVALPQPIPLSLGATYVAATGFSNGFPVSDNAFGAGDPYSAGIVSGPLTAYSDQTGSRPAPFSVSQGSFSVASSDPTAIMPAYGYQADNFWVDVQVEASTPSGASYRLWPNYPTPPGSATSETTGYTLATEVRLSAACSLDNIWFYSPAGSTALPSLCAIWNVSSQAVVPGTLNNSPAWSGAAGSGWVSCAYSDLTLPAGDYKAAVFYGGGATWFQSTIGYWSTGAGGSGITSGPVTAPNTSAATSPGQSTYTIGTWAYPLTYASDVGGENYWVDVEVTPT